MSELFMPTPEERWFAEMTGRTPTLRFSLLVLLKCFHYLGFFPTPTDIPEIVIAHIRTCMSYTVAEVPFGYDSLRTLYRHHALVRDHLGVKAYGKAARHCAAVAMRDAARKMEQPADLINAALEQLIKDDFELPAFRSLDDLAHRIRTLVNTTLYDLIASRITEAERLGLDALLSVPGDGKPSAHAHLKNRPQNVTPTHVKNWEHHVAWLSSLGATSQILDSIVTAKRALWAAEARSMDAPMTAAVAPARRYALLICLIHEEQMAARDALVTMFIRCIAGLHTSAKDALAAMMTNQGQVIDGVIATLDDIARLQLEEGDVIDNAHFGELVRTCLDVAGGAEAVHDQCQTLLQYRGNNHLPLLFPFYRLARGILFKILRLVTIHASSSDNRIVRALEFVLAHAQRKGKTIAAGIDLSFASEAWQRLIRVRDATTNEPHFDRQAIEVCVVSAVADELQTGDLWVEGAGVFADLRAQLLPREETRAQTTTFCAQMGLPDTGKGFVAHVKELLTSLARQIDQGIPGNKALEISANGNVVLKRRRPKTPQSVLALEAALLEEMPVRSVLEGLRNVQHWTNFTHSFGPLTGSEPKLKDPLAKYLLTIFGYGTNLGPSQLARHVQEAVDAQTFGRINGRHISIDSLDRAVTRIVDTYYRCELPHAWGNEKVASADGTMQELREGNLMTEYHVRYGRFGGIAFHYVSSLYIALISHFIPCGAWEGIYLIDAYLQNTSLIQPTTLHTDTQVQM